MSAATRPKPTVAEQWARHAGALAAWTDKRLVNRRDAYGHYIAVEARTDPDLTAFTDKSGLTLAKLERHFRGASTGDILGLHSTARDEADGAGEVPECWSRWGGIDIDRHDESTDPAATLRAALAWCERLETLGFRPLLIDSNGRGGYHLVVVFSVPVPTANAYRFLRWLTRDWQELGLAERPETYPKQPAIKAGGYGNWLRLPGRHHTRDHWSKVWGDDRWLEGTQAVRAILGTEGDPSERIPAEALADPERKARPKRPKGAGANTSRDAELARDALSKLGHLVDGYDDWIEIGQALTPLGSEGLALWEEWSSQSTKYQEGDCARKWRTFTPDGGRTLGTLFHHAKQRGWEAPGPKIRSKAKAATSNGNGHRATLGDTAGGFAGFAGPSRDTPPDFTGAPLPLAVDLAEVPELVPALIPGAFRDWLTDHARRCCLPIDYAAVSALVSLGALASRKLAIRPKRRDDWLVVPNLWGAAVGPPGLLKSEATSEGQRFLRFLEARAAERHAEAMTLHEMNTLIAAVEAKAAKDAMDKAARKGASREQLEELAHQAVKKAGGESPKRTRYIVGDASVEKLSEHERDNPGLLSARDELTGLLRTMDRPGHENDRAYYLESWNGTEPYFVDRIQRGDYMVPRHCLSIFGTIQPGPLARYIREASTNGAGCDGLLQRFQLLVYPDPPDTFLNVDDYPDAEAKQAAREVFEAVDALDPVATGLPLDESKNLHFVGFDDEAQAFFDGWREDLENRLRSGELSAIFQAHVGKYRSLMPSLALLFHLIDAARDGNIPPVSLAAAELAAAWCDYLEAHARRIYSAAFEGDVEPAERLAEKIRQSIPNPFTYREIAKKGWAGLGTSEDVRRAVGILEDRGWVRVVEVPADPIKGGRPSETVWIHPQLRGGEGQ